MGQEYGQLAQDEWVSFPGGELEGRRPKALCAACRAALQREAAGRSTRPDVVRPDGNEVRRTRPLCFQCYRADLDRQRGIAAAGQLDTSSQARFQYQLPLEPVDRFRLDSLKTAGADARIASVQGIRAYIDKGRPASVGAPHAVQPVGDGQPASR